MLLPMTVGAQYFTLGYLSQDSLLTPPVMNGVGNAHILFIAVQMMEI